MRLYRGLDPSAVYFRRGRQFYAIRPEMIPVEEVDGIPRGAVPITDAEMGRVIARTLLDSHIVRRNARAEASS